MPELDNILTEAGAGAGAGETTFVSMVPGSVEAPRKVKPGNSAYRSFISCKWHAESYLSATLLRRRLLMLPQWRWNQKPGVQCDNAVRA